MSHRQLFVSAFTWLLVLSSLPITYRADAQTLLIDDVKGYTMNASGELVRFSSLLVKDGKVASLNPDAQNIPASVTRLPGKGLTLLPGLIDAHGHLLGLGDELRQVNLRGTVSEADAVSRVKQALSKNLGQQWLVGRGWNQELWKSKTFPTKTSLDDVSNRTPIWLQRIDNHAGWANSDALALANITAQTPDPEGGKIIRDEDGEPTGVLIDKAMNLLEAYLPQASKSIMDAQLKLAGDHLLSLGITSMHDAGISSRQYEFYLLRAAQGSLPIRIYAMIAVTDPDFSRMLDNGPVYSQDDMLHIRSVKVYGDGALGSRGAALITPYTDKPSELGLLLTPPDTLNDVFASIIGEGFQLNYHAIGDKANNLALNAYENAFSSVGGKQLRHRIEHAQVVALDDIPRFAQLNVLPSMQPTHATSDMNMAENRVGKRIKGAYAWQSLWQSGARLPLGSDFPVELANPFYGLHAAVTRQNRENQPVDGWYSNEALSIEQAFDGFTRTAAYGGHMETKIGMLQPGMWADFIFVDRDIFSIDPKTLWQTEVLSTWIAGEKRYERP